MKLSPRMLAATIAATVFTSGLIMTGEAQARHRYGYGQNQASFAYDSLTQEKKMQYDAIMKDYADRTSSLREKLRAKSIELNALSSNPNADPKALQAVSQEMASLQTQMEKETAAMRAQMAKEVGIDFSAYGGGYGRPGRGGYGGCYGGPGYHRGGYYHNGYNGHYDGDGCAPGYGAHHGRWN